MATIVTKTVKPSGGDYTSLSAWEAGQQADLPALDEIRQAECYSMADTTAVTVDGWTTDATRSIQIYTPASERHDGKWNTGKYRNIISGTWATTIAIAEDFVSLVGLQVDATAAVGDGGGRWINYTGGGTLLLDKCIFRYSTAGTRDVNNYGVRLTSALSGFTVNVRNCIFYDAYFGIVCEDRYSGTGTIRVNNSTFHSCYTPVRYIGSVVTVTEKNCGAASCTTSWVGGTQTTCSTSSPTFVDETGDDFHLSSSDTIWKDQGTDLSGDTLPVTDDIDGVARSGSWDIGADEYVAVGGTLYERTVTDGMVLSDTPWKQESHYAFESMLFSDTQKFSIDKILIDRVLLTDSISKSMSAFLRDALFLGDSGLAQIIAGLVERLLTDKILLFDYSQKIQEGKLIDGVLLGDQRGAINLTKVIEDRFFITDTIVLQALKILQDKVLLGDSGLRQKVLQLLQVDMALIADLRFSQTNKSIQDVVETSEYGVKFIHALMVDNTLFSDQSTQLLLSSVVEYLISVQLRMVNLLSIQVGQNGDYLAACTGQNNNYLGKQIGWNNTEVVWQ